MVKLDPIFDFIQPILIKINLFLIKIDLFVIKVGWFNQIQIRFNQFHRNDSIGFQEFGSKKSIKPNSITI